ncbi:hypothetical protein GOBAR_AA06298 [Gossypium barbadense]|uniref:Uncharacterized protein n=1 Tax=Gossypium barbadense TaxID=3634 RepID=A0A2P5YFB9_GOSBA|nr:hypothetical protein GOBAR_AA06298 [Gossypium barbadense]
MNKGQEEVNDDDTKQEPPRTKTTETVHYYHVENKDTHEERRLQIEELDEWRAHKLRIHDKPKLRQNEFDTSPNLLKVGDKVLLDAADPHIVNTNPNRKTPLTVLSIFPFGTRSTNSSNHPDHPLESFSEHTARHTGVPKAVANRGRDTAVLYGRVKARHYFPKTRDAINPHGRATWSWINFIGDYGHGNEKHGRARGKARFCFFETGARHAHAIKPRTIIQGHVAGHNLNCKNSKNMGSPSEYTGVALGRQAAASTRQMSPQGILSMLNMRMIESRRGTSPQHEDPPTQPPPPSRPVFVAASYADISERLT